MDCGGEMNLALVILIGVLLVTLLVIAAMK
jgi:hypothetical protein